MPPGPARDSGRYTRKAQSPVGITASISLQCAWRTEAHVTKYTGGSIAGGTTAGGGDMVDTGEYSADPVIIHTSKKHGADLKSSYNEDKAALLPALDLLPRLNLAIYQHNWPQVSFCSPFSCPCGWSTYDNKLAHPVFQDDKIPDIYQAPTIWSHHLLKAFANQIDPKCPGYREVP